MCLRKASMGGAVAEGVPTAKAVHALMLKMGVDCPIMEGIYRVIHGEMRATPQRPDALACLPARTPSCA